eukprot:scaffold80480_cov37-Tisochrysis_lutea.AAC.2
MPPQSEREAHILCGIGDADRYEQARAMLSVARMMHAIRLDEEAAPAEADVEEEGVRPPDGVISGQVNISAVFAEESSVVIPDPPVLALPRHPDRGGGFEPGRGLCYGH